LRAYGLRAGIVIGAVLVTATSGQLGAPGAADADDLPTVSVDDTFVMEHGAGTGVTAVSVVLPAPQDEAVTVTVTTSDASATAPEDYTAVTQILEIPAGQSRVDVEIAIAPDDVDERNERFSVELSAPVNADLGDAEGSVLIVDAGTEGASIRTGVRVLHGVDQPSTCPPGATCTPMAVDCLGLPTARAYVAFTSPVDPPRGLVVMLIGSGGRGYYDDKNTYVTDLTDAGLALARVNWPDGWNNPLPTGPYGVDTTACRAATLVDHLYESEYIPLDIDLPATVCGFCLTGNSSGGLVGGYLLADYGLETILDAVVATSGPLPSKIAEACLEPGGDTTYTTTQEDFIDVAYGVLVGKGPCALKDASYAPVRRADGLVDAGDDFVYPETRFDILVGGLDHTSTPAHATAFYNTLLAAGNTTASYTVIPTAGHTLADFLVDPAAKDALTGALTWEPEP